MKKKIIFAMSTALLAAGLLFGVSYEAQARVCKGSQDIGRDGGVECDRFGEGCMRNCRFLEMN